MPKSGRMTNSPEPMLNPDMPAQELRLCMGELTRDEMLVARAAIRWANSVRFPVRMREEDEGRGMVGQEGE